MHSPEGLAMEHYDHSQFNDSQLMCSMKPRDIHMGDIPNDSANSNLSAPFGFLPQGPLKSYQGPVVQTIPVHSHLNIKKWRSYLTMTNSCWT